MSYTSLCWAIWTYHFIRNINSPLESVAPMIFSGSKPRSNPLGLLSSLKYKILTLDDQFHQTSIFVHEPLALFSLLAVSRQLIFYHDLQLVKNVSFLFSQLLSSSLLILSLFFFPQIQKSEQGNLSFLPVPRCCHHHHTLSISKDTLLCHSSLYIISIRKTKIILNTFKGKRTIAANLRSITFSTEYSSSGLSVAGVVGAGSSNTSFSFPFVLRPMVAILKLLFYKIE